MTDNRHLDRMVSDKLHSLPDFSDISIPELCQVVISLQNEAAHLLDYEGDTDEGKDKHCVVAACLAYARERLHDALCVYESPSQMARTILDLIKSEALSVVDEHLALGPDEKWATNTNGYVAVQHVREDLEALYTKDNPKWRS